MRLSIVTNVPAPYRIALWEHIDDLLRAEGGQLTILYGAHNLAARKSADATRGRQWEGETLPTGGVESVFIGERPLRIRGRETYVNPRVLRRLAASRPDVVAAVGFRAWIFLLAGWCFARQKPYLLWSGETRAPRSATPAAARAGSRSVASRAASSRTGRPPPRTSARSEPTSARSRSSATRSGRGSA